MFRNASRVAWSAGGHSDERSLRTGKTVAFIGESTVKNNRYGSAVLKVLVTGLHRSGTSVVANLIARASRSTLKDDPDEAIRNDLHTLGEDQLVALLHSLEPYEIVKAPRLTELLIRVQGLKPELKTVHVVRDPRDVYASILEKVIAGRPTRMLDNGRFDPFSSAPHAGVAAAARQYHSIQATCLAAAPGNNVVLCYEHIYSTLRASIDSSCQALGLDFETTDEDLFVRQWGPPANKVDPGIGGPGRWKRAISTATAAEIDDFAGESYRSIVRQCARVLCARHRDDA